MMDGIEYKAGKMAFIDHVLSNPPPENIKSAWYELIRVLGGEKPNEAIISAALNFIDSRKDCSDFVIHSIIRMLYQFPGNEFSEDLKLRTRRTVLGFKYFPDEPGIDSMCTWTENHYILFTSAAYLAGQLFPLDIFPNAKQTGKQKMELNRSRILRWLDLRYHTGFSEWLSNVYYDEDLTALLSLVDFCEDKEIVQKAKNVLDLLLLDMALNSFEGVFGATHGRSYEDSKKWNAREGTTDTFRLLFGVGEFSGFDNMSAPAFALSKYQVPSVIEAIVQDLPEEFENRQRMGIKLSQMEKYGIRPDNFEDGMHYLTMEAYLHPKTIANTLWMFDVCNWWENKFLQYFKPYRQFLRLLKKLGALPALARLIEKDICRNTREEVNIYTYRTPDYMLSTAQDYRKGYGGDQQHIWQATLGPDVVCFTTHPAKLEGPSPNYWTGSGLLPRAAQYKNLAVIIYKITRIPALYVPVNLFYTHAWFPKDMFDEVVEENGWIFGRYLNGYIALWSMQPTSWNEGKQHEELKIPVRDTPEDINREIIAPGDKNIWLCQMGRKSIDGDFSSFIQKILNADLHCHGLEVSFRSPGIGMVEFGWHKEFRVNDTPVVVDNYPRYQNPYVHANFPTDKIEISCANQFHEVDWDNAVGK